MVSGLLPLFVVIVVRCEGVTVVFAALSCLDASPWIDAGYDRVQEAE